MVFVNGTGTIGIILDYLTYNLTGSLYLTLLLIILTMISFAVVLRIPIEWTAILVFPMLITIVAFNTSVMPVVGVGILYLAILLAKNFFFK